MPYQCYKVQPVKDGPILPISPVTPFIPSSDLTVTRNIRTRRQGPDGRKTYA